MLNLLITSLELKTPNLALYLLGYEVKKPVSSTNLQDPGQSTALAVGMFIFKFWALYYHMQNNYREAVNVFENPGSQASFNNAN